MRRETWNNGGEKRGGRYRVHVGGCNGYGEEGERAVYRMHIEASFHGHRRLEFPI